MGSRISRQVFDTPFKYIDHTAPDLDENHTQGPDTIIVPPSYFHVSATDQIQEIHRASES